MTIETQSGVRDHRMMDDWYCTQFDATGSIDEDVGCLHVSMDDEILVQILQRLIEISNRTALIDLYT